MSKVTQRRSANPPPKKKKQEAAAVAYDDVRDVRISHVLFGLVLIAGTMVTGAAWMGGSLSSFGQRWDGFLDSTSRSMGFAIEHIVIEGVSPAIDQKIRSAILIEPGEHMFKADPEMLRGRVESTELVMNVRVNRFWPNRVIIVASPREPIALLQFEDGYAAIDRTGGAARIELPNEEEQLLKITGSGAPQAVSALIDTLALYPGLAARIETAHRVSDRRWDLDLTTGHTLRLPDDLVLGEALQRLDEAQTELSLLDRYPAVIDLRSQDRMFIKLQSPLTAALQASVEDG